MKIHEIDRRGFLRGLGAAAMAGATGSAMAAPFSHGNYKDQLSGENQGEYSTVKSDNGDAVLEIDWKGNRAFLLLPRSITIYFQGHSSSNSYAYGRMKVNAKISDVNFYQLRRDNFNQVEISGGAVDTIKKANGEVLFEVPVYNSSNKIFKFTIEQDSISTSRNRAASTKKSAAKKDGVNEPTNASDAQDIRQSNLDKMKQLSGSGNSTIPSASYAGRLVARIKPNITFTDEVVGNPKAEVEVRTSSDGTILGRRLLSSSGNNAWDSAVLKAIDKTAVLPRDTNGSVPSTIHISFRPKD